MEHSVYLAIGLQFIELLSLQWAEQLLAKFVIVDVCKPNGSVKVPRFSTDVTLFRWKLQLRWPNLILLLREEWLPIVVATWVAIIHITSLQGRFCTFGFAAMDADEHSQVEFSLDSKQWLDITGVTVGSAVYAVQHNSQRIFLEAVHLRSCSPIEIRTLVEIWSAGNSSVSAGRT